MLATARFYNDLALGKGLVLVKMMEGIVGQLHASRASIWNCGLNSWQYCLTLVESFRKSCATLVDSFKREELRNTRREFQEELHHIREEPRQAQLEPRRAQLEFRRAQLELCQIVETLHQTIYGKVAP